MARNALRRNRVRMCQWTPKRRTVTGRNYCPYPALTGSNYCGSHRSRCEREDRIRQLEEELQRRPRQEAIQPVQQQPPDAEQPLERRPRGRPPKTRTQAVQQARNQPDPNPNAELPRLEGVTKTPSTADMDTSK